MTGETFLKGILYFILKAGRMGGKYRSRKQVAGKNGKLKYVYDYGKKNTAKKKVTHADIQKYKDKKMSEDDDNIIIDYTDDDEPLTPKQKKEARRQEVKEDRQARMTPEEKISMYEKLLTGEDDDDDMFAFDEDSIRDEIKKLKKKIEAKNKKLYK